MIRRPAMASAIASYTPLLLRDVGSRRSGRGRGTRCAPARHRPRPPRGPRGRRPPSRGWRPRRTASRRGRRRAARPGRADDRVAQRPRTARRRYSSSTVRRRIDVQLTASTVEEHDRALGHAQHVRPGRDDHRDVAGPGQDGGVRRRAPLGEHHSGDQAEVQAGRLGGRQVARDQDALGRHLPRGPAGQHAQHLVTDRVHVRGPLAEVGVGQVRPLALDLGEAARPGGSGPDAGADAGLHVGQHLGVGEQRQVRVEDARLLGAHLSRGEDPDRARSRGERPPRTRRCGATPQQARPRGRWSTVDRHGRQPARPARWRFPATQAAGLRRLAP